MITKKLKHNFTFDVELSLFQVQFNNVIHYAFNRYVDRKGNIKDAEVETLVKTNMNNIDLLDASFIKQAVSKAKTIYTSRKDENGDCDKVIFGGKYLFNKRIKNVISHNDFLEQRLQPIKVVGGKADNGNRKFSIDLKNHKVIFKRDKSHHYEIELNGYSKKDEELLYKLQEKYDLDKSSTKFTVELDKEYVYLTFEESEFSETNYNPVKNRVASIDMNPNYIALVIQDENGILLKRLYSLKPLNDFSGKKKNNKNKTIKKHLNNKRKHETLQISKDIVNTCIHYKVESFVAEDLNIKSKNANKGKRFNRLCLNNWLRKTLFNNLQKRCNLNNIQFSAVYAGYSSIKGQLENDKEIDSIAAAIEIGKRKNKNLKKFGDSKLKLKDLSNRWKNEVKQNFSKVPTWKEFSNFLKKKFKNSSYRNFFSENNKNIRVSYSLNSKNNYIKVYSFI